MQTYQSFSPFAKNYFQRLCFVPLITAQKLVYENLCSFILSLKFKYDILVAFKRRRAIDKFIDIINSR